MLIRNSMFLYPFLWSTVKSKRTTLTKTQLLTYPVWKISEYQVDSLMKDSTEKLFAKADSLFDKHLSSPRTKLSYSIFLILDGSDIGAPLTDFAQKLRPKNAEAPKIYSTLLDAADITPSLFLNPNAKKKTEETGILSKSEQRNNEIYREYTAKVMEHMVQFSTKIGSGYQIFTFKSWTTAAFKNILHKNFPNLPASSPESKPLSDAETKSGAWIWHLFTNWRETTMKLLVGQEMFGRTIDSKLMKTKGSKETLTTFSKNTKRNRPTKNIVTWWNGNRWRIQKFHAGYGIEM